MISDLETMQLLKDANRHILIIIKIRELTPSERNKTTNNMPKALRNYYKNMAWDKDCEELHRIYAQNEKEIEKLVEDNFSIPDFLSL